MAKEDEKVTLSRTDLEALIDKRLAERTAAQDVKTTAAVAAEAVRGVLGITAEGSSREERIHAELGTPVPERKPIPVRHQKCANPRTGSTFTAVIAPSRTYPDGRVVDLIDYRYPDDIASRVKGMPITNPNTTGDPTAPGRGGLTVQFLQWRYETYDKADRGAFVGESARFLPRIDGPDGDPKPVEIGESARVYVG